ncbi:hypothetical protein Pfo_020546 [Paulownia fortunei]|nr:hypothetical protein Pfo_020546 [Paulownia fortunei]
MGGVGKTTLAKHINNRLLKETQEFVFWVTVSQVFIIKKLQDEIADVVGLDLSNEYNEGKRAARLNGALSLRKNFVLILEDVWESINLEKLGDPLSVEGYRLMITTRSSKVCLQIGYAEMIEVKTPHTDEGWSLFSEELGKEAILAPDVQKIAKSMAKVCDGLPLGIIALAGSMRGETAIHVWKDALAELQKSIMGQDDMEHQVFKVLKYRFDRLDPNHHRQGKSDGYTELQLCFLYCSLYPEDYKIGREELVRKFISEELVGKKKSTKAQLDRGHSILDKLVNVCLLESTRHRKYGDSVKMHDLVRAMALKITEGKTMVMARHSLKEIPNEEERTKDLEKMSLMENGIKEIPPELSPNCPKLSTLLLCRNPLEYIPDSFFSQMHALCTLDLCNTCIKVLPNSVSDLESLKVLVLRLCRGIIYVPNLGKLKALRELDLSYIEIKEVPQVLEKLVNLKRLSLEGAYRLEMLPTGLLLNFPLPYQIQTPVEEIERLKNVCDFSRYIRSRPNWDTLYSIRLGSSYEGIDRWDRVLFDKLNEQLMAPQELQFPSQTLEEIVLMDLPNFMGVIHKREIGAAAVVASPPPPQDVFSSIRNLSIYKCKKMKKLGLPVSEFPNLEKLSVGSCDEIEEIIEVAEDHGRGEGEGEGPLVSLPKLKVLELEQLPKLKSICKATMIL